MSFDFFVKKLAKFFCEASEESPFAEAVLSNQKFSLRQPLLSEYGEFVALLQTVWTRYCRSVTGDYVGVRVSALPNWPDYTIKPFQETEVERYAATPNLALLIKGSWWVRETTFENQFLLVSTRRISSWSETLLGGGYSNNRLRIDLYPQLSGTFTELLFNDPLLHFQSDLYLARKSLLKEEMENITDRDSLFRFVHHSENDNFIDTKSPLTIESPELRLWFSWLRESDHDIGVRLLNRIMAVCLFGSGVVYAVKRNEQEQGSTLRPVVDYWTKDSLANALRPLHYKIENQSSSSAEERPAKRRRVTETVVYWFNVWLDHHERAQVRQVVYAPWNIREPCIQYELASRDYIVTRSLNTFTGYPVTFDYCKEAYLSEHGRRCIDLWRELTDNVICNKRTDCYEYFHNWFSFVVQKPLEKTKVAIIMKSQQGVGKGFISQVLNRWFGVNFKALSGTSPDQKFNSFLINKKIVWIDEMAAVFRDMNVMNSLVTEPYISIERKGIDQTTEANLANFIGGTNNVLKLPLTSDSRRWCLLSAKHMLDAELLAWRQKMRATWTAILEDPEHGDSGAWALMYWYMTRDITGFIPMFQIPETDDLINCMEYDLNQVESWWRLVLENKVLNPSIVAGAPLEHVLYTWQDLYNLCNNPREERTVTGQRKRAMTLRDFKTKLEKVAVLNLEENKVRFRPWPEQYWRWKEINPKIKILNMDIRDLEPNPFVKQLLEQIQAAGSRVPDVVKGYSYQEKDYLIVRLLEKLGRDNVELNESLLKRSDKTNNKDLVLF